MSIKNSPNEFESTGMVDATVNILWALTKIMSNVEIIARNSVGLSNPSISAPSNSTNKYEKLNFTKLRHSFEQPYE